MERYRRNHKRSKSASSFEGLNQAQKHKTASRLSSDSYSYTDGDESIRDDMSVEVGQSSFGRATARPLENLLAERVIKENKPPKRRSLSIIARLLRFEALPFLRNAHKQKKTLDNNRQKNTSISIEADRQLYDDQSNKRSSKKQQEFKDLYPDLETSSFVSGCSSPRWSSSSMLTKSEMALIQQNLDANRLTYDETINEKFLGSEELDDTIDMLDPRLTMMQFDRKQNSLINHVYDQQDTSSSSLDSCTPLLNLPSSAKYGNLNSRKLGRDTTGKHIAYNQERDDDLLLDPHYLHIDCISHSMSDIQLEEKNSKNILPTRIVVLSPNLGDRQNKHGSSPYHSQDYIPNSWKNKEHPSVGSEDDLSWRTSKSYHNAEFLKPEHARKLANKITSRLRDVCDNSEDAMYSGLRRSLVDESLYDVRETDLDSELEMFKRLSRRSVADDHKRGRHPSAMSVHEEAKKRLAERWKITQRYQDLQKVGKVSTISEILSSPNEENKSKKTTYGSIGKSSSKVGIDNGRSVLLSLLGTVSRGVVKDTSERTSRSRSVSPISGKIHGKGTCHDILPTERHLLHGEPKIPGTSKVTGQYSSHKDHYSSQVSKFRSESLPCPPIYIEKTGSSSEARFKIEMHANDKVPYRKLMFQMVEEDDHSGRDVSEMVATNHGITTLFSRTSLLHPNHPSADDERSSSTAHDQNDFHLQELHQGASDKGGPSLKYFGDKSVYSESSKDADYASPVSVLEVASVEDASSISESVERVSGELSELRMKLQLLKMECDACDDKSTHFLIGKDNAQSSSIAKGWEASYMLDVLIHAGLGDFGFDLFRIMWLTPDCPLESWLFYKLEDKYCNEISGSRPERRLLFDRINSVISEIFLKHVDVRTWVMPHLARSLHLTRQKQRARDNVEKLMIGQESANGLQVSERMLDMETQWNPTEEIALTGNKIEVLLIDDMIDEFLSDLSQ